YPPKVEDLHYKPASISPLPRCRHLRAAEPLPVPRAAGRSQLPTTAPTIATRYSWPANASAIVTVRAAAHAGVMSPNPTVARVMTLKYRYLDVSAALGMPLTYGGPSAAARSWCSVEKNSASSR